MTGKGLFIYSSGDNYEGEFFRNCRHGNGTQTLEIGKMIKKDGKGTATLANGDVLDACWSNGLLHGFGVFRAANGDVYTGDWADGDAFDGCLSNEFRHGFGVYRYADGHVYMGNWKKDKMDGK
jgi:1-phosphatidylinositol-4-phosphate 5-kinase